MEQIKHVIGFIIVILLIFSAMLVAKVNEQKTQIDGLEKMVELQRIENAELLGELWIMKDKMQKEGAK